MSMSMSPPPHPSAQPDVLRDARLALALRHMPDAELEPAAALRNSVLQAAERALLESPRQAAAPAKLASAPLDAKPWRTWWTWLVGQPGDRVAWVGALASLLLASLITVMWSGHELPDVEPRGEPVATTGRQNAQASSAETGQTVATAAAEARSVQKTAPPARAPAFNAAPPQPDTAAKTTIAPPPPALAREVTTGSNINPPQSAPATMAAPVPPAAPAARARLESVARQDIQIWLDGRQQSVAPEQATALLALLRALPLASTPANDAAIQAAKTAPTSPDNPKSAAAAVDLQAAEAALSVQTSQDERWDISATQVRVVRDGRVSTHPLTHSQWLQLRALAAPAGAP